MPMKSTANTIAAHVSVVRAFFHSGGRKAGTPSETASTPVSATAPWLKARSTRNRLSACTPASASTHAAGASNCGTVPSRLCTTP